MTTALLHSKPRAPRWHPRYREAFTAGLKVHGIEAGNTAKDQLQGGYDFHVLFGPNYWPNTYNDADRKPEHVLCVDRCSVGNKDDFITVGWDGWGGHGQYPVNMTAKQRSDRWDKWSSLLPDQITLPREKEHAVVLGEYPSACDNQREIDSFYLGVEDLSKRDGFKVYFRPHPHHAVVPFGWEASHSKDVLQTASAVITYKTSFGVHCRLLGYRVAAGPASLAGHMLPDQGDTDGEQKQFSWREWRRWLLFTQWHISEIESGEFWEYLCLKQ